jgi:hypothetical protein
MFYASFVYAHCCVEFTNIFLGLDSRSSQLSKYFGLDMPFKMFCFIWIMCVWKMIVVSDDMVVQNTHFQHSTNQTFDVKFWLKFQWL